MQSVRPSRERGGLGKDISHWWLCQAFVVITKQSKAAEHCGLQCLELSTVSLRRVMAEYYEVWRNRGSVLEKLAAMLEEREATREHEMKAATDIARVYRGKVSDNVDSRVSSLGS